MKSQSKASPQRSCLALELLLAVLADQRRRPPRPARPSPRAARTWSPPGSRPPRPPARAPARGWRAIFAGLEAVDQARHLSLPSIQARPAWRPVRPRVAAVGEEELAARSSCRGRRLDLARPRPREQAAGDLGRSSIRPVGDPLPELGERVEHLLADLVAAGPDPGPDRGVGRADRLGAARDDPGGEPAPAAVQHRHPARARRARPGRQSATKTSAARGSASADDVPVDLGSSGCPGSANGLGRCGARWIGDLGAVDLAGRSTTRSGSQPERRARAGARFSTTASRVVVGEHPEVEALEGRRADAAEPGREGGARAGQLGLEPAHPVALAPLHRA